MSTSDSIYDQIAQNIASALNGKTFTVGNTSYTSKCERQRLIYNPGDSDCYIELCGPWGLTLNHAGSRQDHINLGFIAEMHLNGLDDSPPNDPITEQAKNIGAEMIKNVMLDYTRGKDANNNPLALITRIEDAPGYYITGNPDAPEFVVFIHIVVETFVNADNPYQLG